MNHYYEDYAPEEEELTNLYTNDLYDSEEFRERLDEADTDRDLEAELISDEPIESGEPVAPDQSTDQFNESLDGEKDDEAPTAEES